MAGKALTPLLSFAARNWMPILFPAACLSSATGAESRSGYWRTTEQGFWIATKRLSKGRFKWWPTGAEPAKTLRAHQAQLLLAAGNPETDAAPVWRTREFIKKVLAFRFRFWQTDRKMPAEWRYRGRAVTAEDVVFIRAFIAAHPDASRRRLSALLCEAWQWKQANGALCDMICRGLLLMLHRAGEIELPAVRQISLNPFVRRERPQPPLIDTGAGQRLAVPTRANRTRTSPAHGRKSRCSIA